MPSTPSSLALRLGYAGLLPFVTGALLIWLTLDDEAHAFVALGLAAYAALIVSFLGGIHWGLGMRQAQGALGDRAADDQGYVWGVVPSLIGWLAVMMPPHAGLVVAALALIACYVVDRRRYAALGLSAWLTLRFRLTAVAALSCFLGAAGA